MIHLIYLFLTTVLIAVGNAQRVAKVHLESAVNNITGEVTFTETEQGVEVTGTIVGLSTGLYGFHVHELGDVSSCAAAGAHYNPHGTDHGGPLHTVRHVGDLGNVLFQNGAATIHILDKLIALRDPNSILGRSLVLHAEEDDLGLGGDEGSLTTGNAGARLACGVIGISAPLEAWNSAYSPMPLFILTLLLVSFVILVI